MTAPRSLLAQSIANLGRVAAGQPPKPEPRTTCLQCGESGATVAGRFCSALCCTEYYGEDFDVSEAEDAREDARWEEEGLDS